MTTAKRGLTTAKLQELSQGGIFVWGTEDLTYPTALAQFLGRADIQIVGPSWLRTWRWDTQRYTGIVLDHAAVPSREEMQKFFEVKTLVRPGSHDHRYSDAAMLTPASGVSNPLPSGSVAGGLA